MEQPTTKEQPRRKPPTREQVDKLNKELQEKEQANKK